MKSSGYVCHFFCLLILFVVCTSLALTQGDFWTQTNGPSGGAVHCFATASNGNIFIGTGGGGIYCSTDNGNTWSQRNQGMSYGQVNAVVIDSAGRLFAGTNLALFRSTDNGQNWQQTGFSNNNINSLLVGSQGRIFACVDTSLQVSTDNGDSWQYSANVLPSDFCYASALRSEA